MIEVRTIFPEELQNDFNMLFGKIESLGQGGIYHTKVFHLGFDKKNKVRMVKMDFDLPIEFVKEHINNCIIELSKNETLT